MFVIVVDYGNIALNSLMTCSTVVLPTNISEQHVAANIIFLSRAVHK